jgi:hypothetical protein
LGFVAWVLPDSDIAVPIFTRGPVGPGAGYIGQPGTTVIPGSDSLEPSVAIGFRMAAGGWFDDRQNRGVEVGGFVLERVAGSFSAGTGPNDTQGIYRPFRVDVGRGPLESAVTITNPPGLVGTVGAQSTMQLWGLDGGLVFNHCDSFPCRFDSILGLRYADLTESLSISTAAGNVQTVDDFSARTQFYGPQIGGRISCDRGRLGLSSSLKVGLGISHETLSVSGQTTIGGVTNGSGFLANAGNSGRYVRDRFAALPEWGFRINYRMSEMTYASVGYDLLYLSDALRPGDQLQRDFRVTNTGMMVGSAPPLASTDFFAHGLTLALGLKY